MGKNKISRSYKFCTTMFNSLSRIEKGLAFASLAVIGLKAISAIGMDITKHRKNNK